MVFRLYMSYHLDIYPVQNLMGMEWLINMYLRHDSNCNRSNVCLDHLFVLVDLLDDLLGSELAVL